MQLVSLNQINLYFHDTEERMRIAQITNWSLSLPLNIAASLLHENNATINER